MKETRLRAFIPYIVIFLVFVVLRSRAWIGIEPGLSSDSGEYLSVAALPVWASDFYGGGRPITFTLFCKILGRSPPLIVFVQWAIATLSWAGLAAVASATLRSKFLQYLCFCGILIMSMVSEVALWDGIVLSESLAVSLAVLILAGWIQLIRRWSRGTAIFLSIFTFFWIFVRDPHPFMVAGVVACILAAVAMKFAHPRYLKLAGVFVVMFLLGMASLNEGQRRWLHPFYNVVGRRILPFPERAEFFYKDGMPMSEALKGRTGKYGGSDGASFFKDPALAEFRAWTKAHGRPTYVKFLLQSPDAMFGDALHDLPVFIAPDLLGYKPRHFEPLLPDTITRPFYLRNTTLLALWFSGLFLALGYLGFKRKFDRVWIVPLVLLISTPFFGLVIYLGDAGEFPRHALQVAVHLHLGLWLLTLFVLDKLMSEIRSKSQPA